MDISKGKNMTIIKYKSYDQFQRTTIFFMTEAQKQQFVKSMVKKINLGFDITRKVG